MPDNLGPISTPDAVVTKVYADGKVAKTGDSMSGTLVVPELTTSNLTANGGVMTVTGSLSQALAPTANPHLANKKYVDDNSVADRAYTDTKATSERTTSDTKYVDTGPSGDTMAGPLTASFVSSTGGMGISTAPGASANMEFKTNGVLRWTFGKGPGAESPPTNAGAEFNVAAWDDLGNWKSNPVSIARDTGKVTLTGSLSTPSLGNSGSDLMLTDHINANGKTVWGLPAPVNDDWAATKKFVTDADALKVAKAGGDTITGELKFSGPRHTTGVRFIEAGSDPLEQRMIGIRTTTSGVAGLGAFKPADDPSQPLILTPFGVGNPTQVEHAATKQYVDGGGTLNSVTGSIPSNATGMSHVSSGPAGLYASWGSGVAVSGSGIIVYNEGYYRITCFGGFGTSGTGTIRMMQVVLYPSFGIGTNTNWIQTYTTPSANTSGFGAGMSCAGVYYLPANQIIVVRGRQDSGAALTLTATFTCERILGAI